jgi:hypothetical protein
MNFWIVLRVTAIATTLPQASLADCAEKGWYSLGGDPMAYGSIGFLRRERICKVRACSQLA